MNTLYKELTLIYHGISAIFSRTNPGIQLSKDDISQAGNHTLNIRDHIGKGLIEVYKDSKFTEYLIEVDRNEYITSDNRR